MKISKLSILSTASAFALIFSSLGLANSTASALSGDSFSRGNIISDTLFYRGDALTKDQIQKFLNAKVPNCDTHGEKLIFDSTYGDTVTRKKYSERRGVSTPFICLKNFSQSTNDVSSNSNCSAYSGGTKSAAKIINQVAKACKISQKALIVLLQKEQSLITDDWPWPVQYKKATGYGCPDTSGCNSKYYGFFNQVYNAAWQFRQYKSNPENYGHLPNRTNSVRLHPNTACGSKSVNIVNYSTAGLYNYTPYTPNKAALDNLYGTGNSCSSYGNRNFWRMYNDWFGSTHPKCTTSDRVGAKVYRLFSTKQARHFYTGMECEANVLDAFTSYRIEGFAFTLPPDDANGRTGIYRLLKNGRFWTASIKERDNLTKNHGYKLEGTAFIGLKSSSSADKKPVYRLYNSKTGNHLWTPSKNERDTVASWKSWQYEGIAYYVYDD